MIAGSMATVAYYTVCITYIRRALPWQVEVALQTWPEKTQQEIAEQVGCSQWLVSKTREDIIANNNISLPPTRTGKDGKSRPTTYARREPEQIVNTPEFIEPEEEQERKGDMSTATEQAGYKFRVCLFGGK